MSLSSMGWSVSRIDFGRIDRALKSTGRQNHPADTCVQTRKRQSINPDLRSETLWFCGCYEPILLRPIMTKIVIRLTRDFPDSSAINDLRCNTNDQWCE
ncbi:MAG: hypothetical protein GY904_08015 [Planctomycetaceae bacterium]|nr:hypothetical protein [Planctomycetaceae bacterium]